MGVWGKQLKLRPAWDNKVRFCKTINSISCFCSHLSSKRLANADERNSLKQKFKTNEATKLPRNRYCEVSFGAGKGKLLSEGMCL